MLTVGQAESGPKKGQTDREKYCLHGGRRENAERWGTHRGRLEKEGGTVLRGHGQRGSSEPGEESVA